SGNIVVTTASGQATSGASFTVTAPGPPIILGVSPTSGPVDTPLTISGRNFGAIQGSSTVKFKDTVATPSSWHDDRIVVQAPSGLPAGDAAVVVTVNSPSSTVSSNPKIFTVTPIITGLSLTTGPKKMGFVITGANFGDPQGSGSVVKIGGVPMIVVPGTWKDDSITVQVPDTASLGLGSVVVTVNS